MNNEPRFLLIKAGRVHKVINLNDISASERIPAVNSMSGEVIPNKYMTRLHMSSGQKFELTDAEGDRLWGLLESIALPLYDEEQEKARD